MLRSVHVAELTDLGSQLVDQFRLAGSVDVVAYAGLDSVLIEGTRHERAHRSGPSNSSVADGDILSQPSVGQPEALVEMVLIRGGVVAHGNSTHRAFVRLSKVLHTAIQSGDAHIPVLPTRACARSGALIKIVAGAMVLAISRSRKPPVPSCSTSRCSFVHQPVGVGSGGAGEVVVADAGVDAVFGHGGDDVGGQGGVGLGHGGHEAGEVAPFAQGVAAEVCGVVVSGQFHPVEQQCVEAGGVGAGVGDALAGAPAGGGPDHAVGVGVAVGAAVEVGHCPAGVEFAASLVGVGDGVAVPAVDVGGAELDGGDEVGGAFVQCGFFVGLLPRWA